MPFRAKRRHEIWTADVRYAPHSIPGVGNAYVIVVLENYSRMILAYEEVRKSDSSKDTLLGFMESAYRAGAKAAGWDIEDFSTFR